MKTVFVSGRFSGANSWEVEKNVRTCEKLVLYVAAFGGSPLCVNTMGRFFAGTLTYETWIEIAFAQIRISDAMVLTRNWKESSGAHREKAYAESLRKPVFFETELEALHRWLKEGA